MRSADRTAEDQAQPRAAAERTAGRKASSMSTAQRAISASLHGSPRMAAQRQQVSCMFGPSVQQGASAEGEHMEADRPGSGRGASIQRAIDTGKLNVVGENHSEYGPSARQSEGQKVTAVFGAGTYHTEDTFSAMPDIAQEGSNADDKDKLQSFASKADPPFYAITQGLGFIIKWCTDFRTYLLDRELINLINSAQARIDKEMISEPLKKLENAAEERGFVLAHDTLLARIEVTEDPDYPRENLKGRDLGKEIQTAVAELKAASQTYLLKIEAEYAQAKAEFEKFMGIEPGDDMVKKRSVTMGFHAMAHALGGNKGVLKVGEFHLADFESMDLGDVTLSANSELKEFLLQRENAQAQLKSAVQRSVMGQQAVQRVVDRHQPVQLLSAFEAAEWKQQFEAREDLKSFLPFAAIDAAAEDWDGVADDAKLTALNEEITKLGTTMLSSGADVGQVHEAIRKYFPGGYLSLEDVQMVKKYNFDGPIAFTAENVMAWMRLAGGEGTVDDLRYIHHEIYEIKNIQKTESSGELTNTEPDETFWAKAYEPAHGAALMVEIRFLMHAVNLIHKKNYQWQHVAISDVERREEFISALYEGKAIPKDEDGLPDLEQVKKEFAKYIDPELSQLLTKLKSKRLKK